MLRSNKLMVSYPRLLVSAKALSLRRVHLGKSELSDCGTCTQPRQHTIYLAMDCLPLSPQRYERAAQAKWAREERRWTRQARQGDCALIDSTAAVRRQVRSHVRFQFAIGDGRPFELSGWNRQPAACELEDKAAAFGNAGDKARRFAERAAHGHCAAFRGFQAQAAATGSSGDDWIAATRGAAEALQAMWVYHCPLISATPLYCGCHNLQPVPQHGTTEPISPHFPEPALACFSRHFPRRRRPRRSPRTSSVFPFTPAAPHL